MCRIVPFGVWVSEGLRFSLGGRLSGLDVVRLGLRFCVNVLLF